MKKLVEFSAMGLEVVPWSVPVISSGTTRDGRRYRRAHRTKQSRLAEGRGTLEDWQAYVANAARRAWGAVRLPVVGPVRIHFEFVARTPKGHRHGELWTVGVKWNAAKGCWSKVSARRRPEPDVTNMFKATEDALENIIYANDVQSRLVSAMTLYGPVAGVRVVAHEVEPTDFPGYGDPV